MIPATVNNNVETNLPNEAVGFKIKASSKAFKILSSNLYQDKPRAILRELGCNALDAHTAAGIPDEPFVVKLPNAMNEELVIQDFGPGMSHEAITTLYVTFFDSDKTGTNDLVGGLGLGSKSPFSYTDTFTVTSNHDGMSRTYIAFIDEHESPSITLVNEREMEDDERTGIKIQIPVKNQDANEFNNAARTVFSHFPTLPKIGCAVEEPSYKLEIGNARVKSNMYGTSHIIMGPVAYALNSSNLPSEIANRYSHLLGPVDFVANIGDLSIAASREALSYDKPTIENLKEILRTAEINIANELNDQLKVAKTYREAVLLYRQLNRFLSVRQTMYWEGIAIKDERKQLHFGEAYKLEGLQGTTNSMYYTKVPKIRNPRTSEYLQIADIGCIVIKDTDSKPYVKKLQKIKNEAASFDSHPLVLVVPTGQKDYFDEVCLPLIETDFEGAKIFRLSEIEVEKSASTASGRVASKAYFSRARVTKKDQTSYPYTTEIRLLPQFGAYEDQDFTLDEKLKAGCLWAAFNGTTQVELPQAFEKEGLFYGDYEHTWARFMAIMINNLDVFQGKTIIGVPRALASEQPSDMSKNVAYMAHAELLRLAKDEKFCEQVAWYEFQKSGSGAYQTSSGMEHFLNMYVIERNDSGFAATAKRLFKAAEKGPVFAYEKLFVEEVHRVMVAIGIELEHKHFIFPATRWTKFVDNHPMLRWGDEVGWREEANNRVTALINTLEYHYNTGICS